MRDLPAQIGRYEIVKELADGGMTALLLGRTRGIEGFERHVAVKMLHRNLARDRHLVKLFLDEARIAASLHHHNIVQVHDVGEDAGSYYIAMEYVHGEDCRRVIHQATVNDEVVAIEAVVMIGIAAANGLHHAHELVGRDGTALGLVHRDVSPGNILVGYDGAVKIVDFGIAKAAQRTAETTTGNLKNKVSYMSPEMCTGKRVDRRSDVFALGIVLYELATGFRLFKTANDFMTMTAIVRGAIPRPTRYRPDLPPGLENIILRALATSPNARYQSAEALRTALEDFAIGASLALSAPRLAGHLERLFGATPEPWRPEAAPSLIIDETGSTGLVDAPDVELDQLGATSQSPLAKAQSWTGDGGSLGSIVEPPSPESELDWTDDAGPTIARPRTTGVIDAEGKIVTKPGGLAGRHAALAEKAAPATRPSAKLRGTGTAPMPLAPQPERNRLRWILLAAVVAVAVATVVSIVLVRESAGEADATPPPGLSHEAAHSHD